MQTIRHRRQIIRDIHSDRFDRQRLQEVAEERCGTCWDRWPASMMVTEDGLRRCPDCLAVRTEEVKAQIAEHDAARIAERQTRPQVSQAPLRDQNPPHIRVMETASGTRINQGNPLGLVRGGASVQLILKGGDFASSDAFTYSNGISATKSLTGSTQWTLAIGASSEATPGSNNITFNNHTYRGILRVG